MTELLTIILAAGEGTRMKSSRPKVMHEIGSLPMIGHVLHASISAGADQCVVVVGPSPDPGVDLLGAMETEMRFFANHDATRKFVEIADPGATVIEQAERLGTGHAIKVAEPGWRSFEGNIVVLFGDNPLIRPETIRTVTARLDGGADMVVLGFETVTPRGYGRLLLEGDRLMAIREERDASEAERAITLCNSGVMGFKSWVLGDLINAIEPKNKQGEFYLTDTVEAANKRSLEVAMALASEAEVAGVNSRTQLAAAEKLFQARRRAEMMDAGVSLIDPDTVFFAEDTQVARDVTIEPGVWFGRNVTIDQGATIHAYSHVEGAHVGRGASVGPFARLRPGANVGEDAKVGNFVEVKKSNIGRGAKVNHLSYLGDTDIGARTNIGAGTITCNYDGVNKHRTVIGDEAFIGSNTSLVAPVTIEEGAYIGSGSVITRNVGAQALAIARGRQVNKEGFATVLKERALAKKRARRPRKSAPKRPAKQT
jgi:bifunctional UDP-N-acetylglucosamine pyrophosphorylase / glucosamine-1-phosphate N-acetyltransferase